MARAKGGGRVQQFAQNGVLTLTIKPCQNGVFRIISQKTRLPYYFASHRIFVSWPTLPLRLYISSTGTQHVRSPRSTIEIVNQLDRDTIHQVTSLYFGTKPRQLLVEFQAGCPELNIRLAHSTMRMVQSICSIQNALSLGCGSGCLALLLVWTRGLLLARQSRLPRANISTSHVPNDAQPPICSQTPTGAGPPWPIYGYAIRRKNHSSYTYAQSIPTWPSPPPTIYN